MKQNQLVLTGYINYLLVAYAFVAPISRAGIVFCTILLLLLWLLDGNISQKWQLVKNNPFLITLILFILWNFVSLLWSDALIDGVKYIKRYWYLSVIFVMYTSAQKRYIPYMISAFLIGMLVSEIISYGIFFEWWHFKNVSPHTPSPFMHRIHYSLFLALTALLILNKIFLEKRLAWKITYVAYFTFVTVNLFVNGGRTGQLAFIVTLFAVGILHMKQKILSIILMFLLSFGTLMLAYHYSPNFKQRVEDGKKDVADILIRNNYCDSFGRRVAAWIIAGEIIRDYPLTGVGVSDAISVLRSRINTSHPNMRCASSLPHYHNQYIQLAVQLGVPGMLLYLTLFYLLLSLKFRKEEYRNLTIIFVIVYTIGSLFETVFHEQFTLVLFALFAGILLTVNRIVDETAS